MRARPPRLPGFVLGARLGGGPTCDVFSAIDTTGKAGWAVKVLRQEAANDPTNVQLLKREARAGLAVRHPNLVRILRSGPDDQSPRHLVMERVPGKSLRAILHQHGALPPALVANIVRQTSAALSAVHAAGFIHGDVKPDNIQMRPDRSVVLLDLGFAHRPDDGGLFGTGYILGTANYVAPELCEVPDQDSPATDLFSLGVTLFELLTGELPYPTGSVDATMQLRRDRRPDSLVSKRGPWPFCMARLVDRLLDREPERRPCAREVQQELTEFLSRSSRRRAAS